MGCTKETDLSDLHACCAWDMIRLQYNQDHTGDPVNVVTGAFTLNETDLVWPCQRLPLVFGRSYDSSVHQERRTGDLGPGWTHTYEVRIEQNKDSVDYVDDRHARLKFVQIGGQFIAPPGAQGMRLVRASDGWTLHQLDGFCADFDATGRLSRLFRPGPRRDSILIVHRLNGRLERIEGANGVLRFDWANDRIAAVTDASAQQWKYEYDRKGQLVAVVRPSDIVQRYSYADASPQTVMVMDKGHLRNASREIVGMRHVFSAARRGETAYPLITNAYTSEGRVALQMDAEGGKTRFSYNRFTRITAVTDPEGWTTVHANDLAGNAVRVRTPEGHVTEYVYDDRRNLLANIVDGARTEHVRFRNPRWYEQAAEFGARPTAQRSDYLTFKAADLEEGYDDAGNPPILRDALGNLTSYAEYNSFGHAGLVKLPHGREIRTTFDKRCGLPLRREHWRDETLQRWVEWTLDDFGNVLKIVEGAGEGPARVERNDFDSTGTHCIRRESYIGDLKKGFPLVEHLSYDAAGRLELRKIEIRGSPQDSPRKRIEGTGYDSDDNIAFEIRNDNARAYDWDANRRLVAVWQLKSTKAPDGSRSLVERVTYNRNGRRISHEDAAGGMTRFNYDACGRIIRVDSSDGSVTTIAYDRDGRITEQSGKHGTVRTSYDGRQTTTVDALGRTFTSELDALGRLVRTTLDGKLTTWEYLSDAVRNSLPDGTTEIASTDERWWTERGPDPHLGVEWVQDIFGRPLGLRAGKVGSLRMRRQWVWDDSDGERREMEPSGDVTRIVVDNAGAVVARLRGTSALHYDRDEVGRLIRWHSTDSTLDLAFSYGPAGQLASVSSQGFSEQWEHDHAGRPVVQQQVVDGVPFRIEMVWDEAGRLRQAQAGAWWIHVEPEAGGQVTRIRIPDRTAEIRREPNRREIRWDDGSHGITEYGRRGMVSSWQECGGRRWQWTIESDDLGRPGSEIRETPNGTRQLIFRYDSANRLVAVNDETGRERQGWTWDACGNLVESRRDEIVVGRWTVDEADRILDWTDDLGRRVPVEYDKAGQLVRAGKNNIAYDAGGRPRRINELEDIRCSADGSLIAWTHNGRRDRVGWSLGRPIQIPGEIKVWWFDDMVLACQIDGHTRAVWTDPRGSVVGVQGLPAIADYDPWGVPDGTLPLPLGFEGRLRIGDLYDNRARLYLPALGRFAQTDPDGVADDPNTYLYGHGNPLVWSDLTGHSAKRSGIGCLAHMPTVGLLPMVSIDAYRAVGIDVASTYIKDPPFLDFGRARYVHRNKEGKEVGRTYVVGPGFLESRPHFDHYDNQGERIGRSWFANIGSLDSLVNFVLNINDPPPHLVTYDTNSNRLGSTWVKRPAVTMFTGERLRYPHLEPHLVSYDQSWDRTGATYLVRPGRGESRPHLVHYE